MEHKHYLQQLHRALRWRLPPAEAEEILSDYQEVLASAECTAESPASVARSLTDVAHYRRWLAAFGAMALCLALHAYWVVALPYWNGQLWFPPILFALGAGGALFWFTPRGKRTKTPLPRGLRPALGGLLALALLCAGVIAALALQWLRALPPAWYGRTAAWALTLTTLAATAAGVSGLVGARLSDRRWRALYVLGLLVAADCALVLFSLRSMDINAGTSLWLTSSLLQLGAFNLAGLAATGVALC